MKILIVTHVFYPETFRVNALSAELVKRGHQVTVLTGYPQYPQCKIYEGYGFKIPYEKDYNGVKIERMKVPPRGKTPFGLLRHCYSFVRLGNKWVKKCKEKFDAIYVFGVSPVTVGLPAIKYKEKFGAPVFFNVQDLWPESVEVVLGIKNKIILKPINKIVDKIYSGSDKILCSSRPFVDSIAERGVDKDKLVYWPQFCSQPEVENSIKPECYSQENFNIVFTGNIGEAQGLDLLVDTALKLKDSKVRWFLVGDGRARERIENRVKEHGLENIVKFIGRVSEEEANRYIYHADCAYLSFKTNRLLEMTLPAKAQSYMACGAPILVAAGGESARVIEEAKCGFTCIQDADALAEKIINEILPCENLQTMRKNAKDYFESHFKMETIVDKLEELLVKSIED